MINLYNPKEISILKEGGKILEGILKQLVAETKEGTNGFELNRRAAELIKVRGAAASFLGYRNFPAVICISVNDELVHGIPKYHPFKEGDIISLDLGIRYQGLCLDKAVTFTLGKLAKEEEKFLKILRESLDRGIAKAKDGHHLGEISAAIQKTIEGAGYQVITNLSGHGVGKKVHEDPKIPNFGREDEGPILKEGMVLAIEPMASMGSGKIKVKKDGFTIASADGALTGHFEDTIAVTKSRPIILTRSINSG